MRPTNASSVYVPQNGSIADYSVLELETKSAMLALCHKDINYSLTVTYVVYQSGRNRQVVPRIESHC